MTLRTGALLLAAAVVSSPCAAQDVDLLSGLREAAHDALSRAARVVASPLRGPSGRVHAVVRIPGDAIRFLDALPAGVHAEFTAADNAIDPIASPDAPGAWRISLRMGELKHEVPDLLILTALPIDAKRDGRIGDYVLGDWPYERTRVPGSSAYAPPRGLIEVTPANRDLRVSAHFRLGDLVTKGQADVWPKYVALTMRMLDKVEATLAELEVMGHPVTHAGILSAFRAPYYNADGGDGPGDASRHVFGDAMDLYIDNDRDGRMDDLNGDGRRDRRDAAIIAEAADRVEAKYPELTGGVGIYDPRPGVHAGFVHIDARGVRARW